MSTALQRAAIALLSATGTLGATINLDWTISNGNVAPDGFSRAAVLVNGQYPGPTLTGNTGDTFVINVTNALTDATMRRSTSIHWHGLFQNGTASMDGPAFVTQCPISPNWSFTYTIPTVGQAGTFWYHSHLGSQYIDGLRGAIVIKDPSDPNIALYDVDDESTIIQVGDWYHNPANGLEATYLAVGGGNEPVPDSGTINGKGRYICGAGETTCPSTPVARTVVPVTSGQKYRLRFINNSGISSFRCSIQGHKLKVIEADGIPHNPLDVDYFDILAGQRYSVVVNANQTVDNYWITCPLTVARATTNAHLDAANVLAILRYNGAAAADPTSAVPTASGTALAEANLSPSVNPGSPGGASPSNLFTYNVAFTRGTNSSGNPAFKINGQQYLPPSLPTLLNILTNGASASYATSENTITLNRGDIVELNISGGANHPFHLHGHAFDVVKSGANGVVNYVNPPRRDVVATPAIIRFRADNPGPWILHCHIDWHFMAGLAMVFAEAPSDQVTEIPHNAQWDALCNTYNALATEFQ